MQRRTALLSGSCGSRPRGPEEGVPGSRACLRRSCDLHGSEGDGRRRHAGALPSLPRQPPGVHPTLRIEPTGASVPRRLSVPSVSLSCGTMTTADRRRAIAWRHPPERGAARDGVALASWFSSGRARETFRRRALRAAPRHRPAGRATTHGAGSRPTSRACVQMAGSGLPSRSSPSARVDRSGDPAPPGRGASRPGRLRTSAGAPGACHALMRLMVGLRARLLPSSRRRRPRRMLVPVPRRGSGPRGDGAPP